MSSSVETSADLKGALSGGLIHEDVMDRIFNISKIPLPFSDLVGSASTNQEYTEWTQDSLQAPNTANAVVDGADASGNDTHVGTRVGNHHQISRKIVAVSTRADNSNVIGRSRELSYQVMMRQQELRRDVDAIALLNQASVADDGNTVAGKVGGLPSWITTSVKGGTGSAVGGFNTSTKLTTARTVASSGRALSEANIRDTIQSVYQQGGDPSVMMTVPGLISKFSQYMIASKGATAPITQYIEKGQAGEAATALGSVNVFVTDFGTIRAIPNRLQPTYTISGATCADVFILDPAYVQLGYLKGYRMEDLAKTGLSEKRQISVDWSLVVGTEKAHGLVGDVNIALDMVA